MIKNYPTSDVVCDIGPVFWASLSRRAEQEWTEC